MTGCAIFGLGTFILVNGVDNSLIKLLDTDWVTIMLGDDDNINIDAFSDATSVFCVVALIAVIFSFVGCFGVIKESKHILQTYLAVNIIMFIVMIIGTFLGYSTSMDQLQGAMEKTMMAYQENPNKPYESDSQMIITKSWDNIQEKVRKITFFIISFIQITFFFI